jgi:hypothetical protein
MLKKKGLESLIIPLLLFVFATPVFYAIWVFGVDIPYWDQWEYVRFFEAYYEHNLMSAGLFNLHNEYRQLIPNFIFLILGLITKWRVQFEMMVILIMVIWIGWRILKRLENNRTLPFPIYAMMSIFICALLFSPAQYENWLFGVQIVYFFPIACIIACIELIETPLRPLFKWISILSVSYLSTLSSVNGVLCWITLLPLFIYDRKAIDKIFYLTIPILILFCSSLILYLNDYTQPGNLPTVFEQKQSVNYMLKFILRLIGNGGVNISYCLNTESKIPESVGFLIVFCWLINIFSIIKRWNNPKIISMCLPWLIIGFYGLITAIMITSGRSNLGIIQACAPRYIGFTLFFVISSLVLPVILYYIDSKNKFNKYFALFTGIFLGAVLLINLWNYKSNYFNLKAYGAQIARAKAGLLVSKYLPFSEHKTLIYPSGFDKLSSKVKWLNAHGYIRPSILEAPVLKENQIKKVPESGVFSSITARNDSILCSGIIDNELLSPLRFAVIITAKNKFGQRKFVGINNSGNPKWTINLPVSRLEKGNVLLEAWLFCGDDGLFYPIADKHINEN